MAQRSTGSVRPQALSLARGVHVRRMEPVDLICFVPSDAAARTATTATAARTAGRSTIAAVAAKIQPRRTFAGLNARLLDRASLIKGVLIAVVRIVLDIAGGWGLEVGLWIEGIALPGVETRGPDIKYSLTLFVNHGYVVVVDIVVE